MSKWDKGIDFLETYQTLLGKLRRAKKHHVKLYTAMAILQLTNGLRSSESVRAIKHFLRTKQIEFDIKVSKKKREETRLVVIPKILLDIGLGINTLNVDDKILKKRYENWLAYNFKFNTHSLRYAFITFLLKEGINPSLIAKITHHSNLNFILQYTQQKASDNLLKGIVSYL